MYDPLVIARQARLLYARIFQPFSQRYGLTQPEIDIMLYLYQNPEENTARDISTTRGLAKSNVSTAVDSLRVKGYVRVEGDPYSRRVRRLFLVEKDHPMLAEMMACQQEYYHRLMMDFSQKEAEDLYAQLSRLSANIAAELKRLEDGEE